MALPVLRAEVPCDGCTTCCKGDLLVLHPEMGDDPSQYETRAIEHPLTGEPVFALANKKSGDCVYLGEGGCTIHERAPAICRAFDCRKFFLRLQGMRRAQRREIVRRGLVGKDVLDAGKKRLHTLEKETP